MSDASQLTAEQERTYMRLVTALSKRYGQLHLNLTDAINMLYAITVEAADAGDPRAEAFDSILQQLSIADMEGSRLQAEVVETLHNQILHSHSARTAYDQGWQSRLADLMARATSEQNAILCELLIGEEDDT